MTQTSFVPSCLLASPARSVGKRMPIHNPGGPLGEWLEALAKAALLVLVIWFVMLTMITAFGPSN